MKTPSSTTTAVGGDPTTRPKPAAWSSPFSTPHSYTSRPPSLHPTLRPWREFLSLRSFSLPYGYSDALLRLRKNLSHFRFNYVLIALLALFLSLIFHPYSLLLFVFFSLAWYALYFSRDSPIVLFGRVFDDRVVAVVLGLVTIVGLVLTGVGLTVLVALVVAVVIIGVHGVFRNSEDLYVDEESIGEGGLVSVVSSQPLRSYARIGLDTFQQMFQPSNGLLGTHILQRVVELMNMLPGSESMATKVEYHVGDWRPYSAFSFNVPRVH